MAKDMIALRIAPDMRVTVVGSPAYFAHDSKPADPHDLLDHDCICLRLPTHGGLLNWEFMQNGRTVNAHVKGRLVFNRNEPVVEAVLTGNCLAWLPNDLVHEHIANGSLVPVLDDCSIVYPGYHLYYASRRSSLALSLVVDALRLPQSVPSET